jgi:molecular chaperone IbpA
MTLSHFPAVGSSFVGFERLINQLETSANYKDTYPPHNLIRKNEDEFSIELAVAGFSLDEINIEVTNGVLTISSISDKGSANQPDYIHKGISSKGFRRSFNLAEYIEVKEALYLNGILTIDLVREIPEEKKPRKIKISNQVSPDLVDLCQELLTED